MESSSTTIVRVRQTSGRGGFPSVSFRYEVHVDGHPLMRKDGRPRTWGTRKAARAACGVS